MERMRESQHHITCSTPTGTNLVAIGAVFRGRARALHVDVIGDCNGPAAGSESFRQRDARSLMGFVRGAQGDDNHKLSGVDQESVSQKCAPYASDRTNAWPKANCMRRVAGVL